MNKPTTDNLRPTTRTRIAFWALLLVVGGLLLISASPVLAEDNTEYDLLAPLPGVGVDDGSKTATAKTYIPGMVKLIIGLAGVIAVLKILLGGIIYMSTDAVQGKNDGKKHITDALWGLFLVISAWILLNTLNPRLLKFDLTIKEISLGSAFDSDIGRIPTPEEKEKDIAATGCVACVPIISTIAEDIGSTPPKTISENGCAPTVAGLCYLNGELVSKLIKLTENIEAFNKKNEGITQSSPKVTWRVNELFPPSVEHIHACHNLNTSVSGMCTDVSIGGLVCTNTNTCDSSSLERDAVKIGLFMKEARKLGLVVIYEVPADKSGRATALNRKINELYGDEPGFASTVISINIKKEHFSVYLNQSVKNQ